MAHQFDAQVRGLGTRFAKLLHTHVPVSGQDYYCSGPHYSTCWTRAIVSCRASARRKAMGSRMRIPSPLHTICTCIFATSIFWHLHHRPQLLSAITELFFLLDALLFLPETFLHTHLISRVQFAL